MAKGFGTKKAKLSGIFNLKIKDQTDPVIEEIEKKDGLYEVVNTAKDITGDILDFSFGSYEYRGDEIDTMELTLNINREAPVKLSMNVDNGIGRSIINTLASISELPGKEVSISVYTNSKGYASVYIEVDGKKAGWKFGVDEVKKIAGKPSRWVAMGEKFIVKQFEDFTFDNELESEGAPFPTVEDDPGTPEEVVTAEGDDDDLPF